MLVYNWTWSAELYTVPVAWFWYSFDNATVGWTAAMYFSTWVVYLLIAVPEFIFWMMFLFDSPNGPWLFEMWASYPAYYGCWILYAVPAVFALV